MFDPRNHTAGPAELAGRVIAITGAGSGLGRAVALACARHQASVIVVGRNAPALEAVHAEIAAAGQPEASIALLDLEKAVARDYEALAHAVLERYGRLDGLLHNAGLLGTLTPIDHYDVPTWCRVLHVNLTAAFVLTQVLLPALKKSADASLVFTASSVGRRGRAYWGAYAVSKFAVEGLAQVLAAELENVSHVRVNTLNPGRARTAMRRQAYPAEDLESLPPPDSLTGPYIALLGPASRGVTGQAFDAQRPLALEELPHLPAARAAHRERVPAIGGLPAAGLAALDRELRPAVEGSAADALQLRRAELPSHPHAEFARERVNRALQMQRQLAVRGHELEAPIRTRHRTHRDEAPT
ncbi:MAG: YciK family oxidoreductase [Gammaproteobacteria bacterium]|nr:MAG: YciK family oxidoreductase [Gammaproteobacteria bacterium]